jgi:hypothetical protein
MILRDAAPVALHQTMIPSADHKKPPREEKGSVLIVTRTAIDRFTEPTQVDDGEQTPGDSQGVDHQSPAAQCEARKRAGK